VELPLGHRHLPETSVSRRSGHPMARRRVVRHSGALRGSWSPAPGRRWSRTSQRLHCPSASTAHWPRCLPEPPLAGPGGCRHARRVMEVPVEGRNHELPYQFWRPDLDPRGADRAAGPVAGGTGRRHLDRSHRHRSPHPGPGHRPGLGQAGANAGLPGQGASWRCLPPLQILPAESPRPHRVGAAPWHGRTTAQVGTQWLERLGRRGSCPCATGRRLVGRSPRWGRVEIRLGPAWARYRGTATPETDPPSTFHRPVLVPGRHRARSSRLRVTLPRCRPSPWLPSAAMPTAPISPARVRLLLPGLLPCVAGIPARQGSCSGNHPCAPGPAVLHRVAD
jgi:hypothetical protein